MNHDGRGCSSPRASRRGELRSNARFGTRRSRTFVIGQGGENGETQMGARGEGTSTDPRWQRIRVRDRMADGLFWYSVRTTGVFCRPSCPSSHAHPRNMRLHDSLEAARASGARPCKRCNPEGLSVEEQQIALIERACERLRTATTPPRVADLAAQADLSPSHFHRLFKRFTGVTPKDYGAALGTRRSRKGPIGRP